MGCLRMHVSSGNQCTFQYWKQGRLVRLVPALDGTLYEYNGDQVRPLPFTADSLLSSSFKFSEDLVIVGGKETTRYGVSSKNGRVSLSMFYSVLACSFCEI